MLEKLKEKLKTLEEEKIKLMANINAYEGAISFNKQLITELEEEQKTSEKIEEAK